MVFLVEDEVLVDLVGNGDDVVLATQLGDEREFVTSEHLARRIVGVLRRNAFVFVVNAARSSSGSKVQSGAQG